MTRLLAISDEVDARLYHPDVKELEVDLVVSCGDLPFDYLEFIVSALNVPLVYVPGNHDPDLKGNRLDAETIGLTWTESPWAKEAPGPLGGVNADGRIVDQAGLRIAGLGGSVRYSRGPNQYTQVEMRRRARRLERRARFRHLRDGRSVDVVVAHSPPAGIGDDPEDPAHRGFAAFRRLVERLSPRLLLHGHVHPFGTTTPIGSLGSTEVHNVVDRKVLEV